MNQRKYTVHFKSGEKETISACDIQRGGNEWAFLREVSQYNREAFLFIPKDLVSRVEVDV